MELNDFFNMAVEFENNAEAELLELVKIRTNLVKEYDELVNSKEFLALEEAVKKGVYDVEIFDKYIIILNEMLDLLKAIDLCDRAASILLFDYEPVDSVSLDTDFYLEKYEEEINE